VTVSRGSLVVAVAVPLLFLHEEFQPHVSVAVGGTTVDAYLSDFAVLGVVLAALFVLGRGGPASLRPGRLLWLLIAAFFVWVAVELLWGRHHAPSYALGTHTVTALKFFEYALLAPAVPLLVRTTRDLLTVLWSFVLWSCAATAVGIAQFFGADIAAKGTVGHRQASFLSSADFAALSAGALLVAVVAIAVPSLRVPRALLWLALLTGVLGTIVAGAVASVLGLATALAVLGVNLALHRRLDARRVTAVAALAVVVVGGVVTIRSTDLGAFARFLGASSSPRAVQPQTKVQTYAHRTLLAWLGFEIWKDEPLLGVGWEGSAEPANFEPHLRAAHKRFPSESPLAFPSRDPNRRYGVQDAWLEALADLGVVGFLLWAGVFAAAAWAAIRAGLTLPALIALAWTALLVWLWAAQGFVAGIPLDALTWLAFGLAATRLRTE
jgi:O-antigen ligase